MAVAQYIDPGGTGVAIIALFFLIPAAIFAFLWWRMFSKAGWPGALGLLMFVPLVNIVMIFVFALAEWPIQREVRELRQRLGSG